MTEQEIAAQKASEEAAAAEAKAAAEAEKEAALEAAEEAIKSKDAELEKLKGDLENYKKVALKRLGKLEGDADFMAGDKETGLSVEEQVKAALLEREIASKQAEKDQELRALARENAELKLAIKNRPGDSIGSGSGTGSNTEVKDNVFSEAQLQVLRAKAARLGADAEQFIEQAKKNVLSRA